MENTKYVCKKCDEKLRVETTDNLDGTTTVKVYPCIYCDDETYQTGFDDGYEEDCSNSERENEQN